MRVAVFVFVLVAGCGPGASATITCLTNAAAEYCDCSYGNFSGLTIATCSPGNGSVSTAKCCADTTYPDAISGATSSSYSHCICSSTSCTAPKTTVQSCQPFMK